MAGAKTESCAALLLLFCVLFCVTAQALPALDRPVTLHARDQPIEEILSEISRQTGIQFSYSPQAVDVRRPASIEALHLPVGEALRQILDGRYEHKVVRKFIVLRKPRVEIYTLPTPEQQPPPPEKTEYSYITNQQYVKKLCYTDSGTTSDGCLSDINNQNSKMMNKHLAAVVLASVAGVSAQAQQPPTVSEQLGKVRKEFIALVREATDSTEQAVKMAANEINRQVSSLKTFGTFAAAQADTSPAAAQVDTPPAVAQTNTPPAAASGDSVRPIIFTLFYPFSFPELNTERHAYRTSFTLLYGVNSGVSGVELGWLVNVNRRYMSGVQLAGMGNLSLGNVTGTQLAGVVNLAVGDTAKAQLAGVANMAQGADFQLAGIANAARHTAKVQLAGIANASAKGTTKVQVAGIANAAYHTAGVQLAGIANASAKGTTNVQVAGIANAAHHTAGAQVAGIANASVKGTVNAQVAGIANVAQSAKLQAAGIANAADTSRCQVGLVNAARKAGVQVGLVNVCDTSDGVMVGLVNVARRGGLYELEIGADPIDQLNLAYRMGTKKFYTLAELSYRWDERQWLSGVGVGTQITLPKSWSLNVEGASKSILTNPPWKDNGLNMLAQARVTAAKQLTKHLAVFAGPTLYVYYTNFTKPNSIDLVAPYHIFSVRGNHIATKAWIGCSLGVRIN
jgi:hypothetical protein